MVYLIGYIVVMVTLVISLVFVRKASAFFEDNMDMEYQLMTAILLWPLSLMNILISLVMTLFAEQIAVKRLSLKFYKLFVKFKR